MSIASGHSAVPTYVVSASYDKQIRLWDAATGRTVRTFAFQDSQINQLQLIPVTSHLAVTGFGVIRLYDTSTFLSLGSGAEAAPTGTSGSAPPLVASFESQSTMNVTSVGGVPLLPVKRHTSDGDDRAGGGGGNLNDSTSFLGATCVLNEFGMSTMPPIRSRDDPRGPYAPGVALYATSEDGHLRFFDGRSTGTLSIIKDIATGASITCSAVSPDRRFLLTGNQMGIVSVWHLPSVIASASDEYRRRGRGGSTAAVTAVKAAQPARAAREEGAEVSTEAHADPEAGAATTTAPAADSEAAEPTASRGPAKPKKLSYEAQPGPFGSQPLQEIAFGKDYSAIRSIACDPTGHWFVVATNAGKLHFLRFANDERMGGSATRHRGNTDDTRGGGRDVTGDSTNLDTDDRHSNTQSISSKLDFSGSTSNKSSEAAAASARGRETIYRSALVVNELSSNARRCTSTASGGSSPEGKDSSSAAPAAVLQHDGSVLNSQGGNTTGAVVLSGIEQNRNMNSAAAAVAAASQAAAGAGKGQVTSPLSGMVGEARAPLQTETEMELFHSFQAHYKYVLRVAISGNGLLIVTCSADYTIGRFAVPSFMQPEALSRQAAEDARLERLGRRGSGSPPHAGALAVTHMSNDSIASTQAPVKDEHATPASACVVDKSEVSSVSAAAPLGTVVNTIHAGDGPLSDPDGRDTEAVSPESISAVSSVLTGPSQITVRAGEDVDSSSAHAIDNESAHTGKNISSFNSTVGGTERGGVGGGHGSGTGTHSFFDSAMTASMADAVQMTPLKPLVGHNRWVWDCAFSECGHYLFTASSDNNVRMWNGLSTDRPQSTTFVGHTKPVVSVLLYAEPKISPND